MQDTSYYNSLNVGNSAIAGVELGGTHEKWRRWSSWLLSFCWNRNFQILAENDGVTRPWEGLTDLRGFGKDLFS